MAHINTLKDYIRKIKEYKSFLKYLIISKIKAETSSFNLGYFWFIFDTFIWISIYVFIIQFVFKSASGDYLFYITPGILSWTWFRKTINSNSNIFRKNKQLIKNHYFPKYILILAENIYQLINFLITLVIIIIFLSIFNKIPGWHFFYIIPTIIIQFLFTLGFSGIISHINIYVKDSEKFLQYGLRILFYLSPAIYSIHKLPSKIKFFFELNPFTTFFESFRDALIFNLTPGIKRLTILLIFSIILIILSIKLIQKNEGHYAKEI